MPANYAHYRFGTAMLGAMPADVQRTAKRFRRLYDIGLHGPDIFFYYNPLRQTKLGSLGSRMHQQTGKEFFGRLCRNIRLEPSQGAEAYLYGALCHYALDSVCHLLVIEQAQQGVAEHIRIETEFDRFLLDMDGKHPPEKQDLSKHLRLAPNECAVVARLYSGMTEKAVATALRNMSLATKILTLGNDRSRQLMQKGLGVVSQRYQGFVMTKGPDMQCCALDKPLLELYNQAEEKFPDLLLQLCAHLTYNAPLGKDFSTIFG